MTDCLLLRGRDMVGGREIVWKWDIEEGSIDLLVRQNDTYLVIDFKTDRWRNEEVHRFQVATYMQATKRMYQRPVRGCVIYLRDPDQVLVWEGENP